MRFHYLVFFAVFAIILLYEYFWCLLTHEKKHGGTPWGRKVDYCVKCRRVL